MAAPSSAVFMIVGTHDHPLYEVDLTGPKDQQAQYLHQFVLHAALDAVDEAMWSTKEPYLKAVDRFNNLVVAAFVSPGSARFLLLHDSRASDDAIKAFFMDAYEAYVKVIMNPLHASTARITSREFDRRVRLAAKRIVP